MPIMCLGRLPSMKSQIIWLQQGAACVPLRPGVMGRGLSCYLDSQVAGNIRPLYPKVGQYWLKVAHNYELLALQVDTFRLAPAPFRC